MNKTNVMVEFQNLCREIFDVDDLQLENSMTSEDVEEWDSMNHIKLIVAVERKFGFKFDMADLRRVETVGDLIQLIEKKVLG